MLTAPLQKGGSMDEIHEAAPARPPQVTQTPDQKKKKKMAFLGLSAARDNGDKKMHHLPCVQWDFFRPVLILGAFTAE